MRRGFHFRLQFHQMELHTHLMKAPHHCNGGERVIALYRVLACILHLHNHAMNAGHERRPIRDYGLENFNLLPCWPNLSQPDQAAVFPWSHFIAGFGAKDVRHDICNMTVRHRTRLALSEQSHFLAIDLLALAHKWRLADPPP